MAPRNSNDAEQRNRAKNKPGKWDSTKSPFGYLWCDHKDQQHQGSRNGEGQEIANRGATLLLDKRKYLVRVDGEPAHMASKCSRPVDSSSSRSMGVKNDASSVAFGLFHPLSVDCPGASRPVMV